MLDKCVFTVARGALYLKFAFTLARSYRYHNGTGIPFFIITDQEINLPGDLAWIKIKKVVTNLITPGVEFKLNFPDIIPAEKSIFLDADSIVYKNISSIFDIPNSSIVVIGTKVYKDKWGTGIWGRDHQEWLKEFAIPYLIHFPGAFYYLHSGREMEQVFDTARVLRNSGSAFQQHRSSLNEEPILSISLAKYNIHPVENLGDIYSDLSQFESYHNLNVIKGLALFRNVDKTHFKDYMPYGPYSPMIVHTGSSVYNKNPWLFDALRLKLYYKLYLSANLTDLLVQIFVIQPYFLSKWLKRLFKGR